MTWVLNIALRVPSANDRHCNGRDRVSRALYRKLRDRWARELRIEASIVNAQRAGSRKRRIVLTRIMAPRQRPYDFDDLVGGCKPILDAMKPERPPRVATIKSGPHKGKPRVFPGVTGAGLIVDDSPKWVVVEYRQERGPREGCRIELEDLP